MCTLTAISMHKLSANLIDTLQISRFEGIPIRGPEDNASLELLKSHLKGGTSKRKGTLQNYISRAQTESNPSTYTSKGERCGSRER
jgi:hypothetical protein